MLYGPPIEELDFRPDSKSLSYSAWTSKKYKI
jgi:hypothetical protein